MSLNKVDLHLHTTASDGHYKPEELVALAARRGLEVIAITDHDSVAGVEEALEAARSFPALKVIPGVEISTDIPNGEFHVLGYFVDHHDPRLLELLSQLRESRTERAQRMIAKLEGLGIRIQWSRVKELAGEGSVGRPHIAQAMLEKGYIPSFQEAFIKYIGRNGPAYAERRKMTPQEAVSLVKGVGGLPVLAHPAEIQDLEELLDRLLAAGLVGLEAYYSGYSQAVTEWLVGLADKRSLVTSGGSDYHGLDGTSEVELGGVYVPMDSVARLIALSGRAL